MSEESYRGHRIVYSDRAVASEGAGESPSLKVDDKEYTVVVHSDGTFSANEYYYDKFGSVAALGRAVASRLPEP